LLAELLVDERRIAGPLNRAVFTKGAALNLRLPRRVLGAGGGRSDAANRKLSGAAFD